MYLPHSRTPAAAQSGPPGTRKVPARSIPVPDTVSPAMQAFIARPFKRKKVLKTAAGWKKIVEQEARNVVATLPKLRKALGVCMQKMDKNGIVTQKRKITVRSDGLDRGGRPCICATKGTLPPSRVVSHPPLGVIHN